METNSTEIHSTDTTDATGRVSACLTRSLSLLRSAEYHLRVHNTDAAILVLAQAEGLLTAAHEALPRVSDGQRFAIQKRVNDAREKFEDFRARMSEL